MIKYFIFFSLLGCDPNKCVVWNNDHSCGFNCENERVNCNLTEQSNFECHSDDDSISQHKICPFGKSLPCFGKPFCEGNSELENLFREIIEGNFCTVALHKKKGECNLVCKFGSIHIPCSCSQMTCDCSNSLSETYKHDFNFDPCVGI